MHSDSLLVNTLLKCSNLVTRNAGSVTISGPTRTSDPESRRSMWKCSDPPGPEEIIRYNICHSALKDTALFDEGNGGLQVLSHTEGQHDAGQPPPAETQPAGEETHRS